MQDTQFHKELYELMDQYVNRVYDVTKKFPKDELFGVTSQFRRAALSVILNYIEGFARQRNAVLKNFLETSYGSLKESGYLIKFSFGREYMSEAEHKELMALNDRIGRMLWGIFTKL